MVGGQPAAQAEIGLGLVAVEALVGSADHVDRAVAAAGRAAAAAGLRPRGSGDGGVPLAHHGADVGVGGGHQVGTSLGSAAPTTIRAAASASRRAASSPRNLATASGSRQ